MLACEYMNGLERWEHTCTGRQEENWYALVFVKLVDKTLSFIDRSLASENQIPYISLVQYYFKDVENLGKLCATDDQQVKTEQLCGMSNLLARR